MAATKFHCQIALRTLITLIKKVKSFSSPSSLAGLCDFLNKWCCESHIKFLGLVGEMLIWLLPGSLHRCSETSHHAVRKPRPGGEAMIDVLAGNPAKVSVTASRNHQKCECARALWVQQPPAAEALPAFQPWDIDNVSGHKPFPQFLNSDPQTPQA